MSEEQKSSVSPDGFDGLWKLIEIKNVYSYVKEKYGLINEKASEIPEIFGKFQRITVEDFHFTAQYIWSTSNETHKTISHHKGEIKTVLDGKTSVLSRGPLGRKILVSGVSLDNGKTIKLNIKDKKTGKVSINTLKLLNENEMNETISFEGANAVITKKLNRVKDLLKD